MQKTDTKWYIDILVFTNSYNYNHVNFTQKCITEQVLEIQGENVVRLKHF